MVSGGYSLFREMYDNSEEFALSYPRRIAALHGLYTECVGTIRISFTPQMIYTRMDESRRGFVQYFGRFQKFMGVRF